MTAHAANRVSTGSFVGEASQDGLLRFRGIPYGQATRFRRPEPLAAPTGEFDATHPGPICPQPPSRLSAVMGAQPAIPQSEDCLNLSIVSPGLTGDRPVMVWLHGGGFTSGGCLPWYDGGRLATDGDVVVVSVSYRLGAFGYLALDGVSDGNLGLYDQALALQWVNDNIAAFGGDPANITVFGQSAGAMSALLLLSVPESRRLISRVILQSCPGPSLLQSRDEAQRVGEFFARAADSDLHTASTPALLAAEVAALRWNATVSTSITAPPFAPVQGAPLSTRQEDEEILLSEPLPDIIAGYTTDECLAFGVGVEDASLQKALSEETATLIVDPTQELAHRYSAAGGSVFTYEFGWTPTHDGLGAVHCLELPFLLGEGDSWQASPMLGSATWQEVEAIGKPLREQWTRFARTGRPTADDQWPRWTAARSVGRSITNTWVDASETGRGSSE